MNSPADVHQKERISVDVDIFSGTLDIFERNAGYSDPSIHLANLQTRLDQPISGQMRGGICIFPGRKSEHERLMSLR